MAMRLPVSADLRDRLMERALEAFPRKSTDRPLQAWRMATLPFWFGSDVPPPMLPSRQPPSLDTGEGGPAVAWVDKVLNRTTREFWISWCVTSILRGAALGALGALIWCLLAAAGLTSTPSVWLIVTFVLAAAIPGLIFGIVNRPSALRVASMLDRTFALDERLVTAVDPRERIHPDVETMQRADAANALSLILPEIKLVHLVPVREFVLLMVAITSALATWMFAFDSLDVDAITDARVPGYYAASERLAEQHGALPTKPTPAPSEQGDQSGSTAPESTGANSDLQDLGLLGKALDQNSHTESAASAIAAGDLSGAASALDSAAPGIANASQGERDALADELDKAADAMSGEHADLAQQVRDTADAIREGGPEAEAAIADLSDTIESMQPAQGEEGTTASSSETSPGGSAPVGEQNPGGSNQSGTSDSSSSTTDSSSAPADSETSDPGAGSDAAPGTGEQPVSEGESAEGDQPGTSGGSSGEGEASGQQPGDEASGAEGDAESGSSSDEGSSGSTGDSSSTMGNPQDETSSSQGSGAGSGQKDANDAPADGQAPNTTNTELQDPQEGEPSEVETGDPPTAPVGEAGNGGTAGNGSSTLEIGGSSDDTVQSGNDVGSASLGSGSVGAEVSSGEATSQTTEPAGPDSNKVPADYEIIVGDYFSEPVP